MTPNNKDSMLAPTPKRRVTRSVTFKLGLAEFSSVGFFSSHGTTCDPSQRAEVSEELYRDAYEEVERAVHEYKERMEQMAQETLHPERTKAPESNPFQVERQPVAVVAELANPATTAPAASNQVEKKEVQASPPVDSEKIQTCTAEDKGVTEKSTKPSTATPPADVHTPEPPAPRRGRPPKAQPTAEPEPAKAAPAATEGFKASDDDIPATLGGTSPEAPGPDLKAKNEETRAANAQQASEQAKIALVPPKTVVAQWDRFIAVMDSLTKEGKRTKENVELGIKAFCKAFLNEDKLPKPPDPKYEPIIPILETLARTNPGVILADPQKSGLEAGVGWNKLIRHVEKWRPELREAAISVAIQKYPYNAMDLLDFLHNVAKLGNLDKNLYVFLRTIQSTNAAIAMMLLSTSQEHDKPMADIMDGLDFETATEGDILARISGVTKAEAQKATPAEPTGQTGELWQE